MDLEVVNTHVSGEESSSRMNDRLYMYTPLLEAREPRQRTERKQEGHEIDDRPDIMEYISSSDSCRRGDNSTCGYEVQCSVSSAVACQAKSMFWI